MDLAEAPDPKNGPSNPKTINLSTVSHNSPNERASPNTPEIWSQVPSSSVDALDLEISEFGQEFNNTAQDFINQESTNANQTDDLDDDVIIHDFYEPETEKNVFYDGAVLKGASFTMLITKLTATPTLIGICGP